MKKYQTHSVTQVEELLYDYADRIRNAKTKTEKKELLKFIRGYEKQFNNVSDKHINGKEYPNRMYHSDNKLMDRDSIEKLIKSVNVPFDEEREKLKMDLSLRGTISKPQT